MKNVAAALRQHVGPYHVSPEDSVELTALLQPMSKQAPRAHHRPIPRRKRPSLASRDSDPNGILSFELISCKQALRVAHEVGRGFRTIDDHAWVAGLVLCVGIQVEVDLFKRSHPAAEER